MAFAEGLELQQKIGELHMKRQNDGLTFAWLLQQLRCHHFQMVFGRQERQATG